MKRKINLTVNYKDYTLEIQEHWTLLEVLRNCLGLTGTKCSCSIGHCGACTVILEGKPLLSCLVLACAVEGKKIITIEGLAEKSDLHPVQKAFIEEGAIQCGFCTPGLVMVSKALLDENPNPSEDEVREAISGNVCRCTGYHKPVKAIMRAAKMIRQGSEAKNIG